MVKDYHQWLTQPHHFRHKPKDLSHLPAVWGKISQKEMMERFGVSRTTLYRHAKLMNLPVRNRGESDSNPTRRARKLSGSVNPQLRQARPVLAELRLFRSAKPQSP